MFARKWWKVDLALGVTVPELLLRLAGLELGPLVCMATFGGAIVAAEFILSGAAEAVQEDISASLATAILALIAMLPEYGVDLYFAFNAGHIPEHTKYAAANMTGRNRLLLGLGWPLMLGLFMLWGRRRKVKVTQIQLKPQRRVELGFLAVASLYALTIPWHHGIHLLDGVVLLGIFFAYTWRVSKEERTEPDLDGTAKDLGSLPKALRRTVLAGLFLWSALIIVSVAEPFAKSLISGGKVLGLDEFLLVQWVAPLATEAPEFLVGAILAFKGDQDTALGTLLSSKVNQWTLLVGSLPIAYIAGAPGLGGGHHRLRFGFQAVRLLGPESPHGMAHALRWARGDGLLARRTQVHLHLLPAQKGLLFGGRVHDRRGPTPLHGVGRGAAIRGQPWPERGGFRLLPTAWVRADAPA